MERNLVLVALFAALVAALGIIPQIMLPFGVPITAQSLGVMLCGTILGAKRGFLAVLLFVFLVAIGLPLLAGGRGGLGVFASPTGGFVIGFPFAALATGFVTERLRAAPVGIAAGIGAILGGIVVLYGFGILGLSIVLGKTLFEATGLVAVFIAGDVAKAIIAGIITAALAKARPDSVLSRT